MSEENNPSNSSSTPRTIDGVFSNVLVKPENSPLACSRPNNPCNSLPEYRQVSEMRPPEYPATAQIDFTVSEYVIYGEKLGSRKDFYLTCLAGLVLGIWGLPVVFLIGTSISSFWGFACGQGLRLMIEIMVPIVHKSTKWRDISTLDAGLLLFGALMVVASVTISEYGRAYVRGLARNELV